MTVSSGEAEGRARTAIAGALMIIFGTGIATLTIPDDCYLAGALRIPGLILAVSLLSPMLFNLRNDARSLLRGENILLGGLIYWVLLDILQGAYTLSVDREVIVAEFVLLGVAGLGFWLGAASGFVLRPKFLLDEAYRPYSDRHLFRLTVLAFLLGVFDFIYRANFDISQIIQSLNAPRFEAAWQRGPLGDWSAFSFHLQYFGYLVPPLAVLTLLRRGAGHPATIVSMLMALTIMMFHSQGGGRRIVGAMVLAGLFCWMIQARRLNLKRFFIAIVLVGGLLALMQLMLEFRNIGIADTSSQLANYQYLHIDDNFLRIAQMMEFIPDRYPYVGWQYVAYVLVRPIPRVLWPDKPVGGGFDLADVLGIDETVIALTAAGEWFVSYGYIAVLLGSWVYGKFATIANAALENREFSVNPLFPSLVLVWLFVGVRSMVEIILMGYVIIAAVVLSRIIHLFQSTIKGTQASRSGAR